MHRIIGVELSHQNAPLNIREKIVLTKEETVQAMHEMKSRLNEVLIISTCNRLAVYTYSTNYRPVLDFFNRFGNLNLYLTIYDYDDSAVRHLFSTAAGLKSQVVGEHQILGQIKDSYHTAREAGALGPVMHEFSRRAIRAGKRVRGETSIGQFATSIASVAFELVNKIHPQLRGAKVLVLGTGEMANLILQMLAKTEVSKLMVASRELNRASQIAGIYQATPVALGNLDEILKEADVIVGATAAAEVIVSREQMLPYVNGHSKLFIDMGMPRNFAPEIADLENITLHDLDSIKDLTYQGIMKRQKEIPKAKAIINDEVEDFVYWLNAKRVHPLISGYYNQLEIIKAREMSWVIPKMGTLDETQKKIIDKFANRLISHVSKRPVEVLKTYAQEPHGRDRPIDTFREIFNLKDVHIHIPKRRIIVGSRDSKLALAQTNEVIEKLKEMDPDNEFMIKTIKTSGDMGHLEELGAWVKEVERALLDKEIDLAVHSMKDMPTEIPEGVIIAGIPERADPRDVLLSNDGKKLEQMPPGSRIGTTSMRRGFQIQRLQPGMEIVPVRGNIITRMSKLEGGEYDAIILAAAGLQRLGILNRITEIFSVEQMVPAVGQGALAAEIREDDLKLKQLLEKINHRETELAITAERALLHELGGGCRMPIGGYAKITGNSITLHGMYANDSGTKINFDHLTADISEVEEMGKRLAARLKKGI
ncbi:MAG: hydroxymethylbilane synthase [Bacteroidia bacterium]